MNLFNRLSLDQLHTLATALGNTIARLEERIKEAPVCALKDYLARCQDEAAELLDEVEVAFDQLIGQQGLDEPVCRCNSTAADGPVADDVQSCSCSCSDCLEFCSCMENEQLKAVIKELKDSIRVAGDFWSLEH